MNRHDIICLPHPSLREPSEDARVPSKEIQALVDSMEQATLDWEKHREHEVGVALAAVQIDRNVRVIIIRRDIDDKDNPIFEVYVNPIITRFEGNPIMELEGCLSVRDVYGKVARYPRVKVKALDLAGKPIKRVAKGFLARVFQHEIDHTQGLTFVDRVGSKGSYFSLEADGSMNRLRPAERQAFLKRVGYPALATKTK